MSHEDTKTERPPYPLENELRAEKITLSLVTRVPIMGLTVLAMVSLDQITWLAWLNFILVVIIVFGESLMIWFFPHRWVYMPLNDLHWLLAEHRISQKKGKVVKWKRVGKFTLVYDDGTELNPFDHIPNDDEHVPLLTDPAGELDLPSL